MADPLLAEAAPTTNLFDDCHSLAIPPLDPLFMSAQNPSTASDDLDAVLEDNCDFDFTFDDLESLDFLSESESLFFNSECPPHNLTSDVDRVSCLPRDCSPDDVKDSYTASPESGSSGVSGNRALVDAETYLNDASGDQSSNSDSNGCARESCGGPVSSLGSENSGSGVLSETMNASSPDSGNLVVDQKIKVEEISKAKVSKRKKENEETNRETRSSKYHRSSLTKENTNDNLSEEEKRRKARLIRNRESAQLSRQRKKHYVEELEEKVRSMHSTITDLNTKISYFMAENATLRQQLSGGNAPPHMGMYPHPPMTPMPYPWMPSTSPYMVKPQGSQVPLVPIPRLKPQQTQSSAKSKKSDGSRTKKVASVSFLGLLFFILLFGGLVPIMNVKYVGVNDTVSGAFGYFGNGFYDQHRGRVLTVNGHLNGSHNTMGIESYNEKFESFYHGRGFEKKDKGSEPAPGAEGFVHSGNASEPMVASLYVPRNDKLVKIDGNLIIHSVLASEKAMASREAPQVEKYGETSLAIPQDFSPALLVRDVRANGGRPSHMYRNHAERLKALSSGAVDALKDKMKSTAADGKLQQWFSEGLAGPMLSSGMCTEVFQFDVAPSSAPGAIIPASPISNITAEHNKNVSQVNMGKNRRILHDLPVPFSRSNLNMTGEKSEENSQKKSFQGNRTGSSMVVSVLVDPREAGDGDVDGMMTPKSLSRIFVVVLIDRVKYVTYSCMLPRPGPHLVTA